jgi:predicted restriction endonuclease
MGDASRVRYRQMIGGTDLNGKWLGWKSGVSQFEAALVDAGCLSESGQPLLSDSQLLSQVASIETDQALSEIEKESVRKERIGHAQWAADVKSRAKNRCQILSVLSRNLIAGHIKPWATCQDGEHLDRANGLCLSPSIDKLFEDGVIGFTDKGRLLVNGLSREEMRTYGLTEHCSIKVAEGQKAYLRWHRKQAMGLMK